MFDQVHTSYPGLRTMTTAKDPSFGTSRRACDRRWTSGCRKRDVYNQAAANQLRAEGKDMWWYICIGPSRPYTNFFVEYPAIEPRLLMGLMAYKYQTGGFLYYNIAKWLSLFISWHGPITSGPYTNWDPRSAVDQQQWRRQSVLRRARWATPHHPVGKHPRRAGGLRVPEAAGGLGQDHVGDQPADSGTTRVDQLGPTTAGGAVEPRRLLDLVHAGSGGAGELSQTVSYGHSDRQSVDRASGSN